MDSKTRLPALTLIEVLLYLFFFATFFVVIVQFYFFLDNQSDSAARRLELDRGQIFIDQHFDSTISEIISIDLDQSDLTSDPGIIVLNVSPTETVSYQVNSGTLEFTDASGNTSDLTRSSLEVENFQLRELETPQGLTVGIGVDINLRFRDNDITMSQSLNQNYYISTEQQL